MAMTDGWVIGDAYEAYMGRWSRPLARAFIEWLDPKPSAAWLEVGCGTGALTSAICALGRPASVLACDPSSSFVDHARKQLPDPRVTFVAGGAETVAARVPGFDAIVSGLVLNFLPDAAAVVASLRECLRPGGVIAAYVWDYADGMQLLRMFWDEAVAADARAAALDEGRRFPLCQSPELASLFRAAGLAQVATHALEIATDFASFDDYWTPFLSGTGPAPSYVASLDAPGRELLAERLRRRLPAAGSGRIELRARAWAVRGVAA
jgi:trans-aconitate methyltransferase